MTHSYSGAPAEVAAPQLDSRVAHIDSYALADYESIVDFFPPPILEAIRQQAAATGDGWQVAPLPPAMLGLEPPEDIAAVMPRLTPQSLRTIEDRIHIAAGADDLPRTYVECPVGDEAKPFGTFAQRASSPGWSSRTLNAGRDAMITDPDPVAELLLAITATPA